MNGDFSIANTHSKLDDLDLNSHKKILKLKGRWKDWIFVKREVFALCCDLEFLLPKLLPKDLYPLGIYRWQTRVHGSPFSRNLKYKRVIWISNPNLWKFEPLSLANLKFKKKFYHYVWLNLEEILLLCLTEFVIEGEREVNGTDKVIKVCTERKGECLSMNKEGEIFTNNEEEWVKLIQKRRMT